jgi:hypothetical protein
MNFPQFPYSPLRPQTTIEIEKVKTTNSETQPSVKTIVILLIFLQKDVTYHHTWNRHHSTQHKTVITVN